MQSEPRFYTEKHARLEEIRISEIKTQLDNMDFESKKEVWVYLNKQIIMGDMARSLGGPKPDPSVDNSGLTAIKSRRKITPALVKDCELCGGKGHHGSIFNRTWCSNCNSSGKVFC